MLSVPLIIVLAASVVCVPISSPLQGSAGALSSIERRKTTWTSYVCSDANDQSTCKVSKTWTEGDDGSQQSGGDFVPLKQQTTPKSDASESNSNDDVSTQPDEEQETTPKPESTNSNESNTNVTPTPSGDNSMLGVINKWRSAYNLEALSWSQEMVDGAAETGQLNNGNGDNFQHHGRGNAEVMTPGNDNDGGEDLKGFTPFEIGYVAGWLCEVPSGPVASSCEFANSISPM
ncbi:MAG: hypothetical protein Q9184_005815 [Pyrenodesmia sp. 2 TL-2023]